MDLSLISCFESALILVSCPSQQQVVSKDAVVSGKVVYREDDNKNERLGLFENSILVDLFYAFIVYKPPSGNSDIVKRSTMQPARLDGLLVTVLIYLKQRKKRGGMDRKCIRTLS